MSATPIPRTLSMSLSKLKEMVELRTPPLERKPIRTYLHEYDPNLIKEAILRELRRGGQVFYIHNYIQTLPQKQLELEALLSGKRILVLHSKVKASTAEEEMLKFAQGEYDILLSTSIVESGLHLPNVNTIIIEEANRFGMSELHQLRGRVGRGEREGFCYLLTQDEITPQAREKLEALQRNSFLGSGMALAYKDLEIRGAGNLIGAKQSGHIKYIGYSLYLKLLEENIAKISLQEQKEEFKVELTLGVDAYLSDELIPASRLKLELYRRLANLERVEELSAIEEEIEDRFGKLDEVSKNFLDLIHIKLLAKEQKVSHIFNHQGNISFKFPTGTQTLKTASSNPLEEVIRFLYKGG